MYACTAVYVLSVVYACPVLYDCTVVYACPVVYVLSVVYACTVASGPPGPLRSGSTLMGVIVTPPPFGGGVSNQSLFAVGPPPTKTEELIGSPYFFGRRAALATGLVKHGKQVVAVLHVGSPDMVRFTIQFFHDLQPILKVKDPSPHGGGRGWCGVQSSSNGDFSLAIFSGV